MPRLIDTRELIEGVADTRTLEVANDGAYPHLSEPSPAVADVVLEFIDAAIAEGKWKPKTIACYRESAKHIVRLVGATPIRALTPRDCYVFRWAEIDWARSCLRLAATKTGTKLAGIRPLSGPALIVLRRRAREADADDVWVFPGRRKGRPYVEPAKPWATILDAAEIPRVGMHVLRHSLASVAAMLGIPREKIGPMLGHKSTASTDRYLHLYGSAFVAEADQVGDAITGPAGQPAANNNPHQREEEVG